MTYDSLVYTKLRTPEQSEEEKRLAEQAKNFPVKKIPYVGERRNLKFDRVNYGRASSNPARRAKELADRGLSYQDYLTGMHMGRYATAHDMRLLYTPKFAMNDEQLRLAIAQQGYSFAIQHLPGTIAFYGGGKRVPEGFVRNREALELLVNKAMKNHHHLLKNYWHFRCAEMAAHHGGYVALRALIAWRAWREAKDATTIAEEFGMSWVSVRQILHRLCLTALRLGLETFQPHHSSHQTPVKPVAPGSGTPLPFHKHVKRFVEPPDEHLDLTDGVVVGLLELNLRKH